MFANPLIEYDVAVTPTALAMIFEKLELVETRTPYVCAPAEGFQVRTGLTTMPDDEFAGKMRVGAPGTAGNEGVVVKLHVVEYELALVAVDTLTCQ